MRFVDDDKLSFCLTVSIGIKRDELLRILGVTEELPEPQAFDNFVYDNYPPGKKGLLNVFEEYPFIATVENSGFLGVARRTLNSIAHIPGPTHYVAIYHSGDNAGHHYAEVKNGLVLANFDPLLDEAEDEMVEFFPEIGRVRRGMIDAVEQRSGVKIHPEWLTDKTTTYVIDYRTDRN